MCTKILSLDQASVVTGFAVFDNKTLVNYGTINLNKVPKEKRFDEMVEKIGKLIKDVRPDSIVFEEVSLQSNPKTLTKLARIQGAIILYCAEIKCPYAIYEPSSWRKTLGFVQGRNIHRDDLKKQAIKYVADTFNIENIEEDACEAICIGVANIKKGEFEL